MKPTSELDAIRRHAILSSLAGFPFLLVYGIAWIVAGALSYVVPASIAPWLYVFMGVPATPIAIALDRKLGYLPPPSPDPLLPLTLQLLFTQPVAFPAIMLVWDFSPQYVPVAFAAIVGAHFLPFNWVYQTNIYGVLGVVVSVGSYLIAILFRGQAMHLTGFFVGSVLLAGAFLVRAHARRTWIESGGGS